MMANLSIFLAKEALIKDLHNACDKLPIVPILIHSDLFQIGITAAPKDRLKICTDYDEAFSLCFGERPILIPTFNYDFCKDGLYNRFQSPSQVGALSEYFRIRYRNNRTYTPIFNFVIRNKNNELKLDPYLNVFGHDSLFAALHKQNGFVIFLGATFSTNTFLHYVEECNHIGYRYIKQFSGNIIDGPTSIPITVSYRVRPKYAQELIIYDWPKLISEAKQHHVLRQCQVGHGQLLYYQTARLFELWSKKIQADELYLLTPESQLRVRDLYKLKGYPFTREMFE